MADTKLITLENLSTFKSNADATYAVKGTETVASNAASAASAAQSTANEAKSAASTNASAIDALQDLVGTTAVSTQITNKIAELDVSEPSASGTSTTFIKTAKQTDGKIVVTKASLPTANTTTAGIAKLGATGGAATYDAVDALTTRVGTAESEIDAIQGQISGVTGAMHFKGVVSSLPASPYTGYVAGDVILVDKKEYVFVDTTTGFKELGDEGSYLTKTAAASTYATKTALEVVDAIADSGVSKADTAQARADAAYELAEDKLDASSANYVKSLSLSGKTLTVTKGDGTTDTLTTQDTNTTYSAAKYNTLGLLKPAYTSTGAATLTTAAASNATTPTIAAKTTTSDRYYAVESDKNGVAFVNVPWTDNNTVYTHPTTSGNKHIPAGGSSGQILRWSADGTAAWGADNNTTYSKATSSTLGLVKIGYTESGKNYPVELNDDGQMFVNVPWTDNNTTYTLSTITGTLSVAKGGTGATTAAGALTNLGLTATAAELNKLDGATVTTAELNVLSGVTGIATAAEITALFS